MKKRTISVILLMYSICCQAQLLERKVFVLGVKQVKINYYNGGGGGGYWSLKTLDSKGRAVQEENYQNNLLMSKTLFMYNESNDKVMETQLYDINNKERIDTTFYMYNYDSNGNITEQLQLLTPTDSIKLELVESTGDTLFKYRYSSKFYSSYQTILYNDRKVVKKMKMYNPEDRSYTTKEFTYNKNGDVEMQKSAAFPKPEHEVVYVGGPGSDTMEYVYKYDSKGRIKKLYAILDGKKYKLEKRSYIEE
jgi:hypothetical protein